MSTFRKEVRKLSDIIIDYSRNFSPRDSETHIERVPPHSYFM